MPITICAITAACPGEHVPGGSQHEGPDGRLNPCGTCHRPKVNSIKHKRTCATTVSVTVGHKAVQEMPVPMYAGMMLYAHTRKRELVHKLSHLGMSNFYDRVLRLRYGTVSAKILTESKWSALVRCVAKCSQLPL